MDQNNNRIAGGTFYEKTDRGFCTHVLIGRLIFISGFTVSGRRRGRNIGGSHVICSPDLIAHTLFEYCSDKLCCYHRRATAVSRQCERRLIAVATAERRARNLKNGFGSACVAHRAVESISSNVLILISPGANLKLFCVWWEYRPAPFDRQTGESNS